MNIRYNIQIKLSESENLNKIYNLFLRLGEYKLKLLDNTLKFSFESDKIKIIKSQINSILGYIKTLKKTKDL
jgi:hypothetical protein